MGSLLLWSLGLGFRGSALMVYRVLGLGFDGLFLWFVFMVYRVDGLGSYGLVLWSRFCGRGLWL